MRSSCLTEAEGMGAGGTGARGMEEKSNLVPCSDLIFAPGSILTLTPGSVLIFTPGSVLIFTLGSDLTGGIVSACPSWNPQGGRSLLGALGGTRSAEKAELKGNPVPWTARLGSARQNGR